MPVPDPSLVRHFPIFQNVEEADLRAILQAARTRRIEKKAAFFEQGQTASEFFVLLHGHLKVVQKTPDGKQIIVRIVEPGDIFGVAVVLGRPDYPGTAVALEESIALVWPNAAWPRLVARAPALAVNATQTIGHRLQEAHARIREFSTEEVERRVAHLLLRIARMAGSRPDAIATIEFPMTRQEIAEMTGTTLYTVSRVLSRWEQQGLVAGARERIIVKEPARLRELAERAPE